MVQNTLAGIGRSTFPPSATPPEVPTGCTAVGENIKNGQNINKQISLALRPRVEEKVPTHPVGLIFGRVVLKLNPH